MVNPYQSEEFLEFLDSSTDRCDWIQKSLLKRGIESYILNLGEQKHVFVKFPGRAYNPLFKMKTILAHYDRIGIGANDNSAVVYQIINWAEKLNSKSDFHNIRIIFTDGEELGFSSKDGKPSYQGSFGIASAFKRLGMINDDVYAIDSCGRGDVLVVSSTGKDCGNFAMAKKFNEFYERTISLAQKSCPEQWVTIPVPYSDNASFMAMGIPAIGITLLPKEEATSFMRELQKDKKAGPGILNNDSKYEAILPLTWKMMHTKDDCVENLTPQSWKIMEKFLDKLAQERNI